MKEENGRKYFGTDGIRGRANDELTHELASQVAMAVGIVFMKSNGEHRHQVIIGKDTRESGYMLEAAMLAGFAAAGMDVLLCGPLPTPAIAMLTRSMRCDLGVMISASHNLFGDNGIKLFGADGYKLPDEVEEEIERLIQCDLSQYRAKPKKLGRAERINGVQERYIEFAKGTLTRRVNFEGLKIVIDCANGAAHKVAPWALRELGAKVIPIGVEPDGNNINDDIGSTHPRIAAARVLMEKADVGIALDGDADRVIIIDEKGQVVDGDQILAAIASSWKDESRLRGGVVATVMSNLGLERYLSDASISFERTQVGDRYVNERMQKLGYNLGGEQSGHIICSDYSTTGDGLVAAFQILALLKKSGRPASEVLHLFSPMPQILRKFPDPHKQLLNNRQVQEEIEKSEKILGKNGRLLVRHSGTEPVIRVMIEGNNRLVIEEIASSILKTFEQATASVG